VKFTASGHPNVRSTHATTLEITKDNDLTPKGDCIIAVSADYTVQDIKKLLHRKQLTLTLRVDGLVEKVHFTPNPGFNDDHEMVIRKTDFKSNRTLGIYADKAAKDLARAFVEKIKNTNTNITITIE